MKSIYKAIYHIFNANSAKFHVSYEMRCLQSELNNPKAEKSVSLVKMVLRKMNQELASILDQINTLELRYGLSRIDNHQRAIFNFIVKSAAKGKFATPQDVLNTKITSRSSTYRHLSDLTDLEMIYQRWDNGACSYSPTLKLENFVNEIKAL